MIKYDDGVNNPSSCFPVRPLIRQGEYDSFSNGIIIQGDGAWLVAHRAEQRRRFKAVICSRPKTYNTIKHERRKAELIKKGIVDEEMLKEELAAEEDAILDGFFLLRHCNVEDPSDLCTVKINGLGFSEAKVEDFPLFENVIRINAAENMLPIESFNSFTNLQELEVPLCGLRNLNLRLGDFPNLEYLDVSYNELSLEDIFAIGLIPKLKRLCLSGNNLKELPEDLCVPHIEMDGTKKEVYYRFHELEILMLDDNKLSSAEVFASLAGLRRLKILNLSRNSVRTVPHLRSVEGKIVSLPTSEVPSKSGRSSRRSARSARRSARKEKEGESVKEEAGGAKEQVEGSTAGTDALLSSGKNSAHPKVSRATTCVSFAVPKEMNDKVEHIHQKMLEVNRPESAPLICVESAIPNAGDVQADLLAFNKTDDQIPAPFHQLRSINLSHNLIEKEDHVLPVGMWPELSELIIHDNPLTMRRSGDPPMLHRILSLNLGINIIRKKPAFKARPVLAPETRHKVNQRIPSYPRCDVDKLLAIAAAPEEEPRKFGAAGSPLPPIGGQASEKKKEEEEEEDELQSFFMTQVGESNAPGKRKTLPSSPPNSPTNAPPQPRFAQEKAEAEADAEEEEFDPNDFSILYDDDGDLEAKRTLPNGLPATVEALKFMLTHPLTEVERRKDLRRPQPKMRHLLKRASEELPPPPEGTQLQRTLTSLRDGRATEEAPLAQLLHPSREVSVEKSRAAAENQQQAERLLSDIQRKYNVVRSRSMKAAKQESRQNIEVMVEEIREQLRRGLEEETA